jgi:hypothetical protein
MPKSASEGEGLVIDLAEPIEAADGRFVVAVWFPGRRPDVQTDRYAAAVLTDAVSVRNFSHLSETNLS